MYTCNCYKNLTLALAGIIGEHVAVHEHPLLAGICRDVYVSPYTYIKTSPLSLYMILTNVPKQIWFSQSKYESHSHYTKWAYRPTFMHTCAKTQKKTETATPNVTAIIGLFIFFCQKRSSDCCILIYHQKWPCDTHALQIYAPKSAQVM